MRYDPEADVLTVVVSEGGRLSHAEEVGDMKWGTSSYTWMKRIGPSS